MSNDRYGTGEEPREGDVVQLAEQQIVVGSRVRRKVTGFEGTVRQVIEVPKTFGPAKFVVVQFDAAAASSSGHSDPMPIHAVELTDDYSFTTEEN